jgi:ribosomal protein S12 methylthiotransferase accessory factor
MKKTVCVEFSGGKRIDARIDDLIVHTDQKKENGGGGTAPEPFELFLASIATCAGIYALEFCRARGLSTEGMAIAMDCDFDEKETTCRKVSISLKVPNNFPEKYRRAVVRVMDKCSVKRHILNPPEFSIQAV